MIVQETAKLLVDYNRHAIPLDRLACSPGVGPRAVPAAGSAGRLGVAPEQIDLPAPVGHALERRRHRRRPGRKEAAEFFENVEFTAIDFLAQDPERDRLIRARYGDRGRSS